MGVPEAAGLFQILDRNQDGVIDREEFSSFYEMFASSAEDAEAVSPSASGANVPLHSDDDIVAEIMGDLANESGQVDADELASLSSSFFGVGRDAFEKLLGSNGYTSKSLLTQSDVENLASLCSSLQKLDEDIDLDDDSSADGADGDDGMGDGFENESLPSEDGDDVMLHDDSEVCPAQLFAETSSTRSFTGLGVVHVCVLARR